MPKIWPAQGGWDHMTVLLRSGSTCTRSCMRSCTPSISHPSSWLAKRVTRRACRIHVQCLATDRGCLTACVVMQQDQQERCECKIHMFSTFYLEVSANSYADTSRGSPHSSNCQAADLVFLCPFGLALPQIKCHRPWRLALACQHAGGLLPLRAANPPALSDTGAWPDQALKASSIRYLSCGAVTY